MIVFGCTWFEPHVSALNLTMSALEHFYLSSLLRQITTTNLVFANLSNSENQVKTPQEAISQRIAGLIIPQ